MSLLRLVNTTLVAFYDQQERKLTITEKWTDPEAEIAYGNLSEILEMEMNAQMNERMADRKERMKYDERSSRLDGQV
jgi:hypothetical protein